MYRILHVSDVHLDASFAGTGLGGDAARRYREALRETFVRILKLARERKVQAVTIGGDLFEQERFSADTVAFLAEQFRKLNPVKVFIAPGNHDPFLVDSPYSYLDWPANVTIFGEETFTSVPLGEGWTLWGFGHRSADLRSKPLSKLQLPAEGKHVLLFHGSDTTAVPEGKRVHAPFEPRQVAQTGAKLLLTGHYHRGRIVQAGKARIVYPGSPEPLGFGEEGDHGAVAVTLDGEDVGLEPLRTNRHEFVTGELDVSGLDNREAVKEAVRRWGEEHGGKGRFLRLALRGELRPEVDLQHDVLEAALAPFCLAGQITDATEPAYDLARLAQEKTVRGEFVRSLLERLEQCEAEERPKLEAALHFGLQAFERRDLLAR